MSGEGVRTEHLIQPPPTDQAVPDTATEGNEGNVVV